MVLLTQTRNMFGKLQKFRARTGMALNIITLTDFCAFKTNLFSLCVKTPLWAAAAEAEHWANPWQRQHSEQGQTSNNAGHWLSSRGSLPASLPACLHKTPIHLGRREWKTWRAHRVIFVSRSLQPPSLSASGACLETGFFISVTKKHCQNMSWRELWKLHFLLNGLCWIILRVYFRVFQNTFKQCG